MTEQQIPKLVACLVEHQANFTTLSTEDAQWVIQNTVRAIALFRIAISNRGANIVSDVIAGHTELWQHSKQGNGWDGYVSIEKIHSVLASEGKLDRLASSQDLLLIQKEGVLFFRKYFGRRYVYGRDHYLSEMGDEVSLREYHKEDASTVDAQTAFLLVAK